jgi:ABC-type transport system substrate-binding protein
MTPNIRDPAEPLSIFSVDSWRQIGVSVERNVVDLPTLTGALRARQFDVTSDSNAPASDDPTEILTKFLPGNPVNYTGNTDSVLIDLFAKQKHELDPVKRKQFVNEFQSRLINQAYIAPLFWLTRTAVLPSNARGWTITPSFVVGHDLGDLWLKP